MNRKDLRKQNITQLVLLVAIVLMVNYISSSFFFRLDLTQEKRYTISSETKTILKDLPDQVLIKVYLDGDLPLGFKKLQTATREMLDEFRVYAGDNVAYQFINPYESNDMLTANKLIKTLYDKGLQPTNAKIKDESGGQSQKIVVPGAIIAFNGVELPINLLSNNPGLSAEENLNNSVQELEYLLISNIKNITNKRIEKIAFLEGHGELDQYQTGDITRELANYYQVDRGKLNGTVGALNPYKVIIIAKPQTPFSEEDKFVLDQYVMQGGKLMWFLDAVDVNADSLVNGMTMAFIPQLNIDDQLFKYGIRINPDLVQDVQCALIPISSGEQGNNTKFIPAPWLYYPLLNGVNDNPVSRNINMVKSQFCSFIDTLEANGKIHKTVLLRSSRFTKLKQVPAFISLGEVKEKQDKRSFNKSGLPIAVLAEGNFESVFKNRMLNNLKIKGKYTFRDESLKTSMIVVADGDIIRNDIRATAQGLLISPLGLDKYTSQTFGNKEFILNAVNYLSDETGLLTLRSREIKLRLLDKEKLKEAKTSWVMINTLLPVALIAILGILMVYIRKRKYS